ncbi:MAG: hypothetical protein AAFR97_10035, partial [Bacteroidota bacterium]
MITRIETFVGRRQLSVKRVMIMGGTALARDTACRLQENYAVTIIELFSKLLAALCLSLDN